MQNWLFALYLSLLFILLSNPLTYRLTNSIFSLIGLDTAINGCPTIAGISIHMVVFFLIAVLILSQEKEHFTSFSGMGEPSKFLGCNSAQLQAQNKGDKDCDKAANHCMLSPNSPKCNDLLGKCPMRVIHEQCGHLV